MSVNRDNTHSWVRISDGSDKLVTNSNNNEKKEIHLLRHSQQVHREEDGAVHLWRGKENLQSQLAQIPYWSDNRWKACLAAGGAKKEIPVLHR